MYGFAKTILTPLQASSVLIKAAETGAVGAELVFPTQAIPLVIAGIPESLITLLGLEHSHVIGVSSLTVPKYSYKKQQPAPMSVMTI